MKFSSHSIKLSLLISHNDLITSAKFRLCLVSLNTKLKFSIRIKLKSHPVWLYGLKLFNVAVQRPLYPDYLMGCGREGD
jgi:hypothetical protein